MKCQPIVLSLTTAALRLEASINGVSGQMFSDLIFISIGSNLVVECFGSGTLAWKSSMDVTIPSSNAGQLYQLPDHSRDVQALHINDFGDMYVATYTCFTDLTDVFGQPVEMSVLITTSKLINHLIITSSIPNIALRQHSLPWITFTPPPPPPPPPPPSPHPL